MTNIVPIDKNKAGKISQTNIRLDVALAVSHLQY